MPSKFNEWNRESDSYEGKEDGSGRTPGGTGRGWILGWILSSDLNVIRIFRQPAQRCFEHDGTCSSSHRFARGADECVRGYTDSPESPVTG
jgi:hypothetical protein